MKPESSAQPNDKRHAANQRNSQKSSGPKTEAGKAASAMNAMKRGLFSPKNLLPGESAEEYEAFRDALRQQLRPRDSFEDHLLEQYIPVAWRLRGLPEIEALVFARYGLTPQGHQGGPGFALVASVQSDNILDGLARYEATKRKAAFKYLDLLRALRRDSWELAGKPVIEAEVVQDMALNATPTAPDLDAPASGAETLPPAEQ